MKKLNLKGTGNGERGTENRVFSSPLFVPPCLREIFLLLFLVTVFFISCATQPKAGPSSVNGVPDFSILPSGAEIYLWADVGNAKPLLEALSFEGMSGKDASRILDLTDTAIAAFYPENSSRRFFLAGWGKYPNLRAGTSMSFSRDWKRVKSDTGNRYWYSQKNKLGVALGPKVAFASDGDPFAPGSSADPAPQGFEEFRRSCVLSGWFCNPSAAIDGFISNLGVPIQIPAEDLFFGAERAPLNETAQGGNSRNTPWDLVLKIRTPSARDARSLLALFSFARIFIPRSTGAEEGTAMEPMQVAALFFANAPEQEEEFLIIRMKSLSESRIALLFNMFSVYSI